MDEPRIRLARLQYASIISERARNRLFPHHETWQEQQENTRQQLVHGTKFNPGDFCLLDDIRKGAFNKSYQVQRKGIVVIAGVRYGKFPTTYKIKDLNGEFQGYFPEERLTKSPLDPTHSDAWTVKKLVDKKIVEIKRDVVKVFYLCRYDGYSADFDMWVESSKLYPKVLLEYENEQKLKEMKRYLSNRKKKGTKQDARQLLLQKYRNFQRLKVLKQHEGLSSNIPRINK